MEFCHTDEIGELLLCPAKSGKNDSGYYGLVGISERVFRANPKDQELPYIRTGLLGYVGPVGIFLCNFLLLCYIYVNHRFAF